MLLPNKAICPTNNSLGHFNISANKIAIPPKQATIVKSLIRNLLIGGDSDFIDGGKGLTHFIVLSPDHANTRLHGNSD